VCSAPTLALGLFVLAALFVRACVVALTALTIHILDTLLATADWSPCALRPGA